MQVREFDLRSLDKMLPCPFCGGDAELDTAQSYRAINGHFGNRVVVYCTKCDADMGACVEDVPDIHPNEVIERWNRRTGPAPALYEALKEIATESNWSFAPVDSEAANAYAQIAARMGDIARAALSQAQKE